MVRAKKHLGQHFLRDENIAKNIVDAYAQVHRQGAVLEIGPGTGVLTKYLIDIYADDLYTIDLDEESVEYLHKHYPEAQSRILFGDFLKKDFDYLPEGTFGIIGNFPYNISSQIFFKILDNRERVDVVVCMLQYEVAKRLASPPGNKDYGILSVLLQAYYKLEYLFDVEAHVFDPPPKVKSGVIRLVTKNSILKCDYALFKKVVKQGFQNRRKTLRNALKPLNLPTEVSQQSLLDRRAETLSFEEFEQLTLDIAKWSN